MGRLLSRPPPVPRTRALLPPAVPPSWQMSGLPRKAGPGPYGKHPRSVTHDSHRNAPDPTGNPLSPHSNLDDASWQTTPGMPQSPARPRVDQVAARLLLARGLPVLMPVARVARSQGTPPSLVSPRRNGEAPPRRPRACWPRRSHGHRRRRPHRGPTPTPTTAAACVTPPRAACTRTPAAWRGRSRIGAMLGRSCCGCPRVCATRAASIASSFLSENPY